MFSSSELRVRVRAGAHIYRMSDGTLVHVTEDIIGMAHWTRDDMYALLYQDEWFIVAEQDIELL
jgi:hypothetical protein